MKSDYGKEAKVKVGIAFCNSCKKVLKNSELELCKKCSKVTQRS